VFPQLTNDDFSAAENVKNNDSIISGYFQMIDGLNNNHVLWYRRRQSIDRNCNSYVPQYPEVEYIKDSIIFWKSYKDFFSQDLNFISGY